MWEEVDKKFLSWIREEEECYAIEDEEEKESWKRWLSHKSVFECWLSEDVREI